MPVQTPAAKPAVEKPGKNNSPIFTLVAVITGMGSVFSAALLFSDYRYAGHLITAAIAATLIFGTIGFVRKEKNPASGRQLFRLAILMVVLAVATVAGFFLYPAPFPKPRSGLWG